MRFISHIARRKLKIYLQKIKPAQSVTKPCCAAGFIKNAAFKDTHTVASPASRSSLQKMPACFR